MKDLDSDKKELREKVASVLKEQLFTVLASSGPEGPHLVIVSYAVSEDLKELVFFTPRQSRKFSNILSNSRVSLFMDNRSNKITDIRKTLGIEVRGQASEAKADADADSFSDCLNLYMKKYPEMHDFATAETSAAIKVIIEQIEVVHDFQNVSLL